MNKVNTVSFDTSSLINILSDSDSALAIENLLKKGNLRIIVSIDAVYEILSGNLVNKVFIRFQTLINLATKYPNQFIISNSISEWIKKEFKSNGELKYIPHLQNSLRWLGIIDISKDLSKFEKYKTSIQPEIERGRKIKLELNKCDQLFKNAYNDLHNEKNTLESLILKKSLVENYRVIKFFNPALKISNSKIRKIFTKKNSDKFIVTKTFLTCLLIRSAGNTLLKCTDLDPRLDFLTKISPGNWTDISIVAQTLYFDFFITNDFGQFQIAKLLNSNKIITAKPIIEIDFLNGNYSQ